MPKFRTDNLKRSNAAGETLSRQIDIQINKDGVFYVNFGREDEIVGALGDLDRAHKLTGCDLGIPRANAPWRLSARRVDQLVEAVIAALDEQLSVDVTKERVIVYQVHAHCSAWRNQDGTLHANGYVGDAGKPDSEKGRWVEFSRLGGQQIHSRNRSKAFQIGVVARVMDKITYRRAHAEKVVYENPEWKGGHFDYSTWGARLNGFVVSLPDEPHRLGQVPYTEEAAQFFYDAMLSVASLGINLLAFFQDEERLQKALSGASAQPLLAVLGGADEQRF